MRAVPDLVLDQAVSWHLASARDDMDWDGFTAWLEADPSHRQAYDEIALTDDLVGHNAPALAGIFAEPANDVEIRPVRRKWPLWAGGAIAASLVALLVVPQVTAPSPVVYATEAQSKAVTLDDGSQVLVAPHSRLTVSGRGQDEIALEGGAYFDIRHDPSRSLIVRAGDLSVTDIGTRFDIQSGDNGARVKVAEGRVRVSGDALAAPVDLSAGKSLSYDPASRRAILAAVAPDDVGAWQKGRLTFDSAPLALVAGDLARYADVQVDLPPALASRRFSGTLSIGDGDTAAKDLAQLMGLALVRTDGGYRLEPAR